MIFGIKTKKDRKIEELQEALNRLLSPPPKIIERCSIPTASISSSYITSSRHMECNDLQESRIRSLLANRLGEELLKRGLPVEKTEMDDGTIEYKVRLKVVLENNVLYRN